MKTTTKYIVRFRYGARWYLGNTADNGQGNRTEAAEFDDILAAAKKMLERRPGYSDVEFIKVTKTVEKVVTEKEVVTDTIL